MNKTTVLATTAALAIIASACSHEKACKTVDKTASQAVARSTAPTIEVKALTVTELSQLTTAGGVSIYDANNPTTRAKFGVIPGAKLLTDYVNYEVSELPAAKSDKLVFYCANTRCKAAGTGAEKAILAGYTDVNVLPAGIMGWTKAGNKVTTL
jgi:rhodanese-related sulfurtransferase